MASVSSLIETGQEVGRLLAVYRPGSASELPPIQCLQRACLVTKGDGDLVMVLRFPEYSPHSQHESHAFPFPFLLMF